MSLVPLNAPEWPFNGGVAIDANTSCADPESFVCSETFLRQRLLS